MSKRPLRKSDWMAIIITIVFFQLMCLWCIDVSTSTLIMEQQLKGSIISSTTGVMTNGFFSQNPTLTYHIGLYGLVITSFIGALLLVHLLFTQIDKKSIL
ncbi:MAG: hypothetical protein KKC68_01445 [Candidatus Thermoplasmatota archaeon]|nr:hypothetical protein [Candidatus Thermoplasmatota archaeon]MBU1940415.1 hypothetical protein [Candidatus Thermoplasmatota archaeon]